MKATIEIEYNNVKQLILALKGIKYKVKHIIPDEKFMDNNNFGEGDLDYTDIEWRMVTKK